MGTNDEQIEISKHLAELGWDGEGNHTVTSIRDLSGEEIAEIEAADRLVTKAGNAAAWQRAHRLFALTMDAIANLQEADPPGPGEIERVRAAAASLDAALSALAEELEGTVQTQGAPELRGDFADHAERVRSGDAWHLVAEIADKSAGSFKAAPADTVWQRDTDGAVISVPGAAFEAITAGQDLLAHHYRAIEPAVEEAAKLLLRIKAEAPGGIPAIVEFAVEGEMATNLTPRQLALGRIEPAMRAARMSNWLAEQDEDGAGAEPGAEPDGDGDGEAVEPEGETEAEVEADGDGEPGDADPEPEVGPDGDTEGEAAHEPVEVSALFSLARTLDGDLEKAWSAALDEALAAPAIETQLAAVFSLVNALQRKLARQAEEMASAGVDSRMEEWPLSEERLANLEVSPGPDTRTKQSGLAQINAFVEVMETFEGLKEPANVTVSIDPDGESVERFWSAGAFALLRDRLWLLERMTREQDRDVSAAIERQDQKEGSEDFDAADRAEAFERLRLATRVLALGDPEAAIYHGLLAVGGALGVPLERVAETLAEDPGKGENRLSEEEVQILGKAAEVMAGSLASAPDLAVATLLAKATLRAAHKLTLGPVGEADLSPSELAELIESRQPLKPLEPEENDDRGA